MSTSVSNFFLISKKISKQPELNRHRITPLQGSDISLGSKCCGYYPNLIFFSQVMPKGA
jgi:hypothetical protein